MRWNEINEAPISDFGAYGDLETPGSFPPNDLKAMKNDKWVKKVHLAFEKTRFDFNLYLYNAPDGVVKLNGQHHDAKTEYGRYHGLIHPLQLAPIIGKVLTRADFEQKITVLLTQNEGDEVVPMTPWIVAHRVAHAVAYADRSPKEKSQEIDDYLRRVRGDVDEFYTDAVRIISPVRADSPLSQRERLNTVAKAVGTFRSAREGNVRDRGEFTVELITQFLVQGKVTLQRPHLEVPATPTKMRVAAQQYYKKFGSNANAARFAELVSKINDNPRPNDKVVFKEPSGQIIYAMTVYSDKQAALESERVRDQWQRLRSHGHPDVVPVYKPVTKRETAAYAKRLTVYEEALEEFKDFMAQVRLGYTEDKNEALVKLIDGFEKDLNEDLNALFARCIGKVFVL